MESIWACWQEKILVIFEEAKRCENSGPSDDWPKVVWSQNATDYVAVLWHKILSIVDVRLGCVTIAG